MYFPVFCQILCLLISYIVIILVDILHNCFDDRYVVCSILCVGAPVL